MNETSPASNVVSLSEPLDGELRNPRLLSYDPTVSVAFQISVWARADWGAPRRRSDARRMSAAAAAGRWRRAVRTSAVGPGRSPSGGRAGKRGIASGPGSRRRCRPERVALPGAETNGRGARCTSLVLDAPEGAVIDMDAHVVVVFQNGEGRAARRQRMHSERKKESRPAGRQSAMAGRVAPAPGAQSWLRLSALGSHHDESREPTPLLSSSPQLLRPLRRSDRETARASTKRAPLCAGVKVSSGLPFSTAASIVLVRASRPVRSFSTASPRPFRKRAMKPAYRTSWMCRKTRTAEIQSGASNASTSDPSPLPDNLYEPQPARKTERFCPVEQNSVARVPTPPPFDCSCISLKIKDALGASWPGGVLTPMWDGRRRVARLHGRQASPMPKGSAARATARSPRRARSGAFVAPDQARQGACLVDGSGAVADNS